MSESHSVVVEKTFAHSPAKVWRALTQSPLLAQWLLKNDFAPEAGRKFQFRNEPMPHWDGVIDCEVLMLEPLKKLSYSWKALGLDSVVLWTLTPEGDGTHVRMEHSGFRSETDAAYKGATWGWQKFTSALEALLQEEA
jgi:uncharacterized protein YndB with AHSA1/START domain